MTPAELRKAKADFMRSDDEGIAALRELERLLSDIRREVAKPDTIWGLTDTKECPVSKQTPLGFALAPTPRLERVLAALRTAHRELVGENRKAAK